MTQFMFTLKHGIIKKLLSTLTTLSLLIPHAVFADTVAQSQRMLNQLGYNAGPVDGAYGGKTKRALEAFYAKSGGAYDGKLDANEVTDLTAAMSRAGIDSTIQSGAEIESNGSLIYIPKQPSIIESRYWWTHASTVADFNGDGIMDAWITGTQNPPEEWKDYQSVTTGDACGKAKTGCDSPLTKPSLFIGTKDGKYLLRDDLVIDNRAKPGQSLARQNLVTDFNGDGKLDIFVADTGLGQHTGFKDSYFLSQPDGTLLESSETHLSHPNIKLFDHGGATGDIDGDGDLDFVLAGTINDENNESQQIFKAYLNTRNESAKVLENQDAGIPKQTSRFKTNSYVVNNPPSVPDGLTSKLVSDEVESGYVAVEFSWNASTDDLTKSSGLTYAIKVGTSEDGEEIMSSNANINGVRKTADKGNVEHNLSWKLSLPIGSYYWSIQAIDASYLGSSFSTSKSFVAGSDKDGDGIIYDC